MKLHGNKTGRHILLLGLLCAMTFTFLQQAAHAQPFVGEIACGGWSFCPNGWAECSGQLMPISENETLFNLIGTTFGGDGQETFAMPNLDGRTMLHMGQGAGLTNRLIGEMGGVETVTLTTNQVPSHNHPISAATGTGNSASPVNSIPAKAPASDAHFVNAAPDVQLPATVSSVGSSQPHNNLQPYLAVKCCIALFGVFPYQN
jgi:microcystin-dependent protein